jgi:hypothetical protein
MTRLRDRHCAMRAAARSASDAAIQAPLTQATGRHLDRGAMAYCAAKTGALMAFGCPAL